MLGSTYSSPDSGEFGAVSAAAAASLAFTAFRCRRRKKTPTATKPKKARQPITVPPMVPLLRVELFDVTVSVVCVAEAEAEEEDVVFASLDVMVTMFSSAPSTQVHCDTLKSCRS